MRLNQSVLLWHSLMGLAALRCIYYGCCILWCDTLIFLRVVTLWRIKVVALSGIWLIVGLILFNRWRNKIGYSVLNHNERKNRGFINERPIVTFLVGSMGSGKTTKIVDMALSQEVMFRDQALEILLEIDVQYPNFPFVLYENYLKRLIAEHKIYNLASIDDYFKRLFTDVRRVLIAGKSACKSFNRHYDYDIIIPDRIFGYDFVRYGATFYDGLKETALINDLIDYAKAFFVYIIQSSYIIGNLSVRLNDQLMYKGNLPLWQNDFFRMPLNAPSRFAHILDFDALRLGRKIVEDDKSNNYFEFGIVLISEIGKERLNALELKEVKKIAEEANQKNDRFNEYLKMIRHSAMIRNKSFVKIFVDEQRPDSWGADARDLCEIVTVRSNGEGKLAIPFFTFEKLLVDVIRPKYESWLVDFRYRRGDFTAPYYIRKNLTSRFLNWYDRINNIFGYFKTEVDIEDGARTNEAKHNYYYISKKKIYSNRFRSDCFADFFYKKSLSSDTSLDDIETFDSVLANFDEMKSMNSYFYNQLKLLVDKEE